MQLIIRHLCGNDGGANRVRVSLLRTGGVPGAVADGAFPFVFTPADREELRWYLENFLAYPRGEFAVRAARAEEMIRVRGAEMFDAVFGDAPRRALYDAVAGRLPELRVVIETAQDDFSAIGLPWEIMCDGRRGGKTLSRATRSFVRSQPDLPPAARPFAPPTDTFNILLIISRPNGVPEIPFLEEARPLLDLAHRYRGRVRVDVLRPPTIRELETTLRRKQGFYHVVHFDGHGSFAPGVDRGYTHSAAREGYLFFEDDNARVQAVSGLDMRRILIEQGVPVVILNACQSGAARSDVSSPSVGSRLLRAGVAGVVAMSYSVYVSTATRFVTRLYGELIQGETLGQATHAAREHLATAPERPTVCGMISLQDWMVPVLFENSPVRLLPSPLIPGDVPAVPEPLFIGRDRAFLFLERMLRDFNVAYLRGMAGIGKTATAHAFLRWEQSTGGLKRNADSHQFRFVWGEITLKAFVDRVGTDCEQGIWARYGVAWRRLPQDTGDNLPPESARLQIVQRFLTEACCEVFFDGVDTPLPDGERDAWVTFLRPLLGGSTHFLYTGRGKEFPLDIEHQTLVMWEMPPQDARTLAEAIRGTPFPDTPSYRELLATIGGNPLVLQTFLPELGQHTPERFTEALRQGSLVISDTARSAALTDVLKQSFAALPLEDRKRLTVLGAFPGFVSADTLARISELPEAPDFVRGVSVEEWARLLGEAESVGFLLRIAEQGFYNACIALPWFLGARLRLLLTTAPDALTDACITVYATYAPYLDDRRDQLAGSSLGLIGREEAHIRCAFQAAMAKNRTGDAAALLSLLARLIKARGAWEELGQLASELNFVVSDSSGGALPGHETAWATVLTADAEIAHYRRDFAAQEAIETRLDEHYLRIGDRKQYARTAHSAAKRLIEQRAFDHAAQKLREVLSVSEDIGDRERLAWGQYDMGRVAQEERRLDEADRWFRQSFGGFDSLGDLAGQATVSHRLGMLAEERLQANAAERFYGRALGIQEHTGDLSGRGATLFRLGVLSRRRRAWGDAENALGESLALYEETEDVSGQSRTLRELGFLATDRGQWERAEEWFVHGLRLSESIADVAGQAQVQRGVGALRQARRDYTGARYYFEQSRALAERCGDEQAVGEAVYAMCLLAEEEGDVVQAVHFARQAAERFQRASAAQHKAIVADTLRRLDPHDRYKTAPPMLSPTAPEGEDDLLPLPTRE